ncbi:MAG TPA: hypothetical protein VK194_04775, partial [Candidatus Deferrimicrobium sp.]|nr:hypothetical protein [Candidatus Deferrimicrobium sp.]
EILGGAPRAVDAATLPAITVGQDVIDFDHQLAGPGMQDVVITLAQNLELENQALLRRDETMLPAIDHGDRLVEMQGRLRDAAAGGPSAGEPGAWGASALARGRPIGPNDAG